MVHRLSSSPIQGSCPKKHKGKQKESPSKILKEFLDNLEDEMICPMSGSECHLDYKRVLTSTILDAATFCKRRHAYIYHSTDMKLFPVLLLTWVTHVGIHSVGSVDGAG